MLSTASAFCHSQGICYTPFAFFYFAYDYAQKSSDKNQYLNLWIRLVYKAAEKAEGKCQLSEKKAKTWFHRHTCRIHVISC
jgi:hypothetical protein